jgi:hypothetical protein
MVQYYHKKRAIIKPTEISSQHIQYNYLPKKMNRSIGESFVIGFEPSEEMASSFGSLYLSFEYNPNDKRVNLESIVQGLGKAFYESGIQTSFERRFRMCLRALNELITESKGEYNIGIIATHNGRVLFANAGKMLMLLFRKSVATSLGLKIPERLFGQVGEGSIRSGDTLLMASSAISKSLDKKQLASFSSQQKINNSKESILQALDLAEDICYSFILIRVNGTDPEEELTPPNVATISKDKLSSAFFGLANGLKSGRNYAKKSINKTAASTRHQVVPAISGKVKKGWTAIWTKYINPNPKQAFIVVSITIITLCLLGLGASSMLKTADSSGKVLEDAIVVISSAEAELAKNNRGSAKSTSNKAKELLDSISDTDRSKIDSRASVDKNQPSFSLVALRLESLIDKIDSITRIPTDNGFPIPQRQLSSITWASSALTGIDPSVGSVVEINPLLGDPAVRASERDLIGSSAADSMGGVGIIMLGKSSLWQYAFADGLQQLKSDSLPNSVDVASYLGNLYLLSPEENQVIRYTKSGTKLAAKTSLLKNLPSGSLNNASSFIVNGNIFITQGDRIRLFEQGSERDFKINNLPEGFGELNSIYYNQEAGYFLVLGSSRDKIALLSADSDSASFVRSYALSGNLPINSFTMGPNSSQLFINTDNKILTYKIEK